jgi:hypothetical protein
MKIIIPTRNRADMIGEKAPRLLPHATLCVGGSAGEACSRHSLCPPRMPYRPGGPPGRMG